MRRFSAPLQTRGVLTADECSLEFVWNGSLWRVTEVLQHWRETGAWWLSARVRAAQGSWGEPTEPADEGQDLVAEVDVWRVLAAAGLYGATAVYDLAVSSISGEWQLRRVVD